MEQNAEIEWLALLFYTGMSVRYPDFLTEGYHNMPQYLYTASLVVA